MRKARVFISCGQKNEREVQIGKSVEKYFKEGRQFLTYFAGKVHSPDALTDNIFQHLKKSEYFIFIDFKREKLDEGKCRGSLFVNQEIAIASFLKLKGIGFVEKGLKREGIVDYQIYNAFPFEDGTQILDRLKSETDTWDNQSVNELHISKGLITKNSSIIDNPAQPSSDWYHIEIWNRNKDEHAFSCLGYVTKIVNIDTKEEIEIPTNELIWSGIGEVEVNLIKNGKREMDAFYVIHGEPLIHFHQRQLHTTNPKYRLPDFEKGRYLITYAVISKNYETASKTFRLEYVDTIQDIVFEESNKTDA